MIFNITGTTLQVWVIVGGQPDAPGLQLLRIIFQMVVRSATCFQLDDTPT